MKHLVMVLLMAAVLISISKHARSDEGFLSDDVLSGDWYFELGAGYAPAKTPWSTQMADRHYDWKGSNPTAVIEFGREFDNGVTIKYQHISNWLRGFPLDDRRETALDHVVIGYKWRW